MSLLSNTITLLSLSTLALAQVGPQAQSAFDDQGDPLVPQHPGAPAPGSLWSSIVHGYNTTDGVAPYHGDLLVSPGDGFVYQIRESDGAQLAAFPVAATSDSWLGYDESRDLIITTNASLDVVRGYTPGNSTPVFDIPSPTPGPVGVAWDPVRDEYAYCDWSSDQIVVLDATTLAVARIFNMGLTRMAGVAYDCTDDVYVVGDRDASSHSLVDPDTGSISLSYATAGAGASIPRGAALSSNGGIWTGDFFSNGMFEQEAGHGPGTPNCGGAIGTNYCVAVANSTGSAASMSATGTASVVANNLVLHAGPVPQQPGIFFYGSTQLQLAFGNGFRCVGGSTGRLAPTLPVAGVLGHALDNTLPPSPPVQILPGSTWNFQAWYRDPAAGGAAFNLSDGLSILFVN